MWWDSERFQIAEARTSVILSAAKNLFSVLSETLRSAQGDKEVGISCETIMMGARSQWFRDQESEIRDRRHLWLLTPDF
jgi:hypothetical protein